MGLTAFISAVLALLLAPGPTNTLMGLAGAQRGVVRVLRLLPAELAGYLTMILPLTWLGSHALASAPLLATGLKLGAALWVMFLALRLWQSQPDDGEGGGISTRRIYITTMLNPKALIFGLVLLPSPSEAGFAPRLGLFCLMVIAAAVIWGSAGAVTQAGRQGRSRMQMVQRLASVWLAFVSITLVAGVVRV